MPNRENIKASTNESINYSNQNYSRDPKQIKTFKNLGKSAIDIASDSDQNDNPSLQEPIESNYQNSSNFEDVNNSDLNQDKNSNSSENRPSSFHPIKLPEKFYNFNLKFRNSFYKISEKSFQGALPDHKIVKDIKYSKKILNIIKEKQDPKEASIGKKFESVLHEGLQVGNWLGNSSYSQPGKNNFDIDLQKSSNTDDISNRIDLYVTLNFEAQTEKTSAIIGLDATTNGNYLNILNKLSKSYNGSKSLNFFGFSQIDYYRVENRNIGSVSCIPRYCIGLNKKDINQIEYNKGRNALTQFDQKEKTAVISRMKILTQIEAQNELQKAMLPKDESAETLHARRYLEKVDQCLQSAFRSTVREIIKSRFYFFDKGFQESLESNYKKGDLEENKRKIIDKLLYSAEVKDKEDPFVMITYLSKFLTNLAKDNILPKDISDRQKLMVQNLAISPDILRAYYKKFNISRDIKHKAPLYLENPILGIKSVVIN